MILSRVFNSSASSWQRIFTDLGVGGAASSPESAEKLGAVAAAHRIFTNSLAALPWQIRRKVGEDRTEAEHDISGILKYRANEYMTPYICEKTIYSYAFWHGTGYAYIDRGTSELSSEDGRISGLIPLPIEPEIYVDPVRGVKWYRFTLPEDNVFSRKISRSFEESQLFIYRFETYDGSLGRGILDIGRETLDTDIKAMKYGNRFYSNGARLSGIVEVDGELDSDKRDMLRDEFESKYSGENAFRVAVLDLGMKYTQLGISQQDAQYIEGRQFSVDEISRITGIPTYMLQSGKQSYQSNEQQQLDFVVNTLTPHLVQIEEEARVKFFSKRDIDKGFYLKKNAAAMLRGTHEARAAFYQKMIGISAMNADEIRADEDKSPLPNGLGQKYWMSKNYAPVDDKSAFGGGEV